MPLIKVAFVFLVLILGGFACSSLPEPKVKKYTFPEEDAYVGEAPKRPYKSLGLVRAKVDFISLNAQWEEDRLCKNYFNKAVQQLLRDAKKVGADSVIDIRSVVFLVDGKVETYSTPECSDDGDEGQVLAQGIAVKWLEEVAPGEAVEPTKPSEKQKKIESPELKRMRQKSVGQGFVPLDSNKKELGK